MGATKKDFEEKRESEQKTLDFMEDVFEPKSKLKTIDLVKELSGMIERVNEGYENELEVYILFSDAEKAFKSAKESILEAALIEADKHESKEFKFYNKTIGFAQAGRYDYSESPVWLRAKKRLDSIQNDMKNALLDYAKFGIKKGKEIIPAIYNQNKRSLKIQSIK